MDILYLVDRLEELVNEGWHIPLTTNVVMDEEEFLDVIDQMRISIPEEVKQAKRVQQEKDRLLSQAKEEADRILSLAREQNQALLADHELVKLAEAQKQEIIEEGYREVEVVRGDADAYAADVLGQLEEQLSGLLRTVQNGITALHQQAQAGTEGQKKSTKSVLPSAAQDSSDAASEPEHPGG